MSDPIIPRGVLTDYLFDTLETYLSVDGILVGDGIAPEPGGWTGGQPGEGDFISYTVLGTGPATKAGASRESIGRHEASWRATYTLRSVGALRQQCDWTADKSREAMLRLAKAQFAASWNICVVDYAQLGGVQRTDATTPALWEVTDTVSLWVEADR